MNFEILDKVYLILGYLPLIVFLLLIQWKKADKSIINFLPFIVLIFVATLVETHFFKYNVKKWIRLYDFLEFYALLFFFYRELRFKKIYSFFAISFFLLFVYLCFTWTNTKIADQPLVISTIVLVLLSVTLWFINVFKNFEETPLYQRTAFYLVGVILLYILSTALSFLSTDFIWINKREDGYILYRINLLFNIISRIVIVIVIYKSMKQKRLKT